MAEFQHKARFPRTKCECETALAIRVSGVLDEPLWIPKSQIDDDSEVWKTGQDGELVTSEWFAIERGLA